MKVIKGVAAVLLVLIPAVIFGSTGGRRGKPDVMVIRVVDPLASAPIPDSYVQVKCQSYSGKFHGSSTVWSYDFPASERGEAAIPRKRTEMCNYLIVTPFKASYIAGKHVLSDWSNPAWKRVPDIVYLLPRGKALQIIVLKSYARARGWSRDAAKEYALAQPDGRVAAINVEGGDYFQIVMNLVGSFSAVHERAFEAFGPEVVDLLYCQEIDRLVNELESGQLRRLYGGYGREAVVDVCEPARATRK